MSQATEFPTPRGRVKATLLNMDDTFYQLAVPANKAAVVATWLRDLSDGYMSFNLDGAKDFSAKRMPGPFFVSEVKAKVAAGLGQEEGLNKTAVNGGPPESRKRAVPARLVGGTAGGGVEKEGADAYHRARRRGQ